MHETYLKLVDQTRVEWRDRGHFFRVASWPCGAILVDYARRAQALRRGGKQTTSPWREQAGARGDALVALDEALHRLAAWIGA